MVMFAFGVGLANFGQGRHVTPHQVISAARSVVPVIASFGATGNLALADGPVHETQRLLTNATGTRWAVVPGQALNDALDALDTHPPPHPRSTNERVTPGLAFALEQPTNSTVTSTNRAALEPLTDTIVAVWKYDVTLANGNLDRSKRRGGWGAVSTDLARQLGGEWTSRSRRTIAGLRIRARV